MVCSCVEGLSKLNVDAQGAKLDIFQIQKTEQNEVNVFRRNWWFFFKYNYSVFMILESTVSILKVAQTGSSRNSGYIISICTPLLTWITTVLLDCPSDCYEIQTAYQRGCTRRRTESVGDGEIAPSPYASITDEFECAEDQWTPKLFIWFLWKLLTSSRVLLKWILRKFGSDRFPEATGIKGRTINNSFPLNEFGLFNY